MKSIKIKKAQARQKKQKGVCFPKEREVQKPIAEINWYEGWNAKVYRHVYNKNSSGKIERNRTTKRKTEGNLGKELGKLRNDMKEIKKAVMNKNKDWITKMRTKKTAK